MTTQEFLTFYRQFDSTYPPVVLQTFIDSANRRFDQFGDDAEEARRLFVAHKLTMYAKTFPAPEDDPVGDDSMEGYPAGDDPDDISSDTSDDISDDLPETSAGSTSSPTVGSLASSSGYSYSRIASSGDGARVTGKRVENVQITYSSGSSSSSSYSSAAFPDLAETIYGQQLLSLLKLYSYPRYVP